MIPFRVELCVHQHTLRHPIGDAKARPLGLFAAAQLSTEICVRALLERITTVCGQKTRTNGK